MGSLDSECDPIVTVKDLGINEVLKPGVKLADDMPANPCGLVAKSLFNDTYKLTQTQGGAAVGDFTAKGIAWESDVNYKFKYLDASQIP